MADAAQVRPRWILHLDLDQFIAAVEVRRRPGLTGRPVVVGGDGDPGRPRQVVATATWQARACGVRSGLPLATARRRCPDAVFLPLDRDGYDEASAQVWDVVRELPLVVEVWGWDEGFLGTDVEDAPTLAQQVRATVAARTGLTCCVGIGDNKLRAKLATGFAKAPAGEPPERAAGVFRLTRQTWMTVMGSRPTTALWGVGPRTAGKLEALGVSTVRDLALADEDALAARFGPSTGPWLRLVGRGVGDRTISTTPWVPRGRSHERTYTDDLVDPARVAAEVADLASRVGEEVVAEGRTATRVTVKVRLAPFTTLTRVRTLPAPTHDVAAVVQAAAEALARVDLDRPVRLLGVRVDLQPPPAAPPPAEAGADRGVRASGARPGG